MLHRIDTHTAAPVDWDAFDAARQAVRREQEQADYLARKARFDALPKLYRDTFTPVGPDIPTGPVGYAWMRERGE